MIKLIYLVGIGCCAWLICASLNELSTTGYITELNWHQEGGGPVNGKEPGKGGGNGDDSSLLVSLWIITPLLLRFTGNFLFLGKFSLQTPQDPRKRDVKTTSMWLRVLGVDSPAFVFIIIVVFLSYIPNENTTVYLRWLGRLGFLVALLAVGSILVTVGIFFNFNNGTSRKLKFGLLLFGLASFIGVSNLMGMSLMLHDHLMRINKNDSYCLALVKNISESSIRKHDQIQQIKTEQEETEKDISQKKQMHYLWFLEGQAKVIYLPEKYIEFLNDKTSKVLINEKEPPSVDNISRRNAWTLSQIVNIISVYYKKGVQVGLDIEGRADDVRVDDNNSEYASNFELSRKRAEASSMMVRKLVVAHCQNTQDDKDIKMLHPIVRDVTYGAGNDFASAGEEEKKGQRYWVALIDIVPMRIFTKKAVNIALDAQGFPLVNEQIKFLDYLYFAMYTITTTGYGDMAPVTPWAKFITIILNVYELIYIVIFFNVLLGITKTVNTSFPNSLGEILETQEDIKQELAEIKNRVLQSEGPRESDTDTGQGEGGGESGSSSEATVTSHGK